MSSTNSILVLMNPGRTSRHYMSGIVQGISSLGLACGRLDLAQAWQARNAGPAAYGPFVADLAAWIVKEKFTHCIAYGHNAASLMTLESLTKPIGAPGVGALTTSLGLENIMLWTDHPEWCVQGTAMDEPMRTVLNHPSNLHVLKSAAAAAEAKAMLGWPRMLGCPMGEDVAALAGTPAASEVLFDVSMVVSDAAAPTDIAAGFLANDDPDVRDIDLAHLPKALGAVRKAVLSFDSGADRWPALEPFMVRWLEAKCASPIRSFWKLLPDFGGDTQLAWMTESPRRWYAIVAAMRRLVNWRRNFWPAWLARRARLGVFGCDASCWGVEQTPQQRMWVEYDTLRAAFTSGACALNINAGHDEEGVTHKPFQIASSGAALVHHETTELDELLAPDHEYLGFSSGPQLLAHVKACGHADYRMALGQAAAARCARDHSWGSRIAHLLSMSAGTPRT